jgi:hypothetical protein
MRKWMALVLVIGCGSSSTSGNDAGLDAATDAAADVSVADAAQDTSPSSDASADAAAPLAISPTAPTATGCSTDIVTFTASGGAPPYTWSTTDTASNDLVVTTPTQATLEDNADNFCGTDGSVSVTVKDTVDASATAVITVNGG